ncbi:MAG: hypothetical protein JNM56_38430 [Planctomycetia bacterium]|nr:hypothetical protein [Planctomycetia bacterium]
MKERMLAVVLLCLTGVPAARAQYDVTLEYPVPITFRYGGFWARDLGGSSSFGHWPRGRWHAWWHKSATVDRTCPVTNVTHRETETGVPPIELIPAPKAEAPGR